MHNSSLQVKLELVKQAKGKLKLDSDQYHLILRSLECQQKVNERQPPLNVRTYGEWINHIDQEETKHLQDMVKTVKKARAKLFEHDVIFG